MKNSIIYQTATFRMGSIFGNPSYQQMSQNTGTTTSGIITANDTSLTFMFFAASPQAYNANPADFYLDNIIIEEVTEVACSDAEIQAYNLQNGKYRWGYQGMLKDNEVHGNDLIYTTLYRANDVRLGRWFSEDPITQPFQSTYTSMDNNPICLKDVFGNSTHTDKNGKVLAVYDDKNLGVYKHDDIVYNKEKPIDYMDEKNKLNCEGENVFKKGNTMLWNSFTNFDKGDGKTPVGTIDFDSYAARDWIDNFEKDMAERIENYKKAGYSQNQAEKAVRLYYAANAGSGDTYDYKSKGSKGMTPEDATQNKYRGSQISYGLYVSARDVGNYGAGAIARITNQDYLDFMYTAGAFNMHQNNKLDLLIHLEKYKKMAKNIGFPTYGEDSNSNYFQRFGFNNIRSMNSFSKNWNSIFRDYPKKQ